MRKKTMRQKLKSLGSFCLILILLPYVVTVFVHGAEFSKGDDSGQVYVKVRKEGNEYNLKGRSDNAFSGETSAVNASGNSSGSGQGSEKGENQEEQDQVMEIPWEEYFIGVMAREVPEDADLEFLKAQAVLTRTKLYQELEGQSNSGSGEEGTQESADGKDVILEEQFLSKDELEQKLGGADFESFYHDLRQAVKETENQVLYYQDSYAWVPFHQSSNGMTRSAQEVLGQDTYPYLTARECPLDKEAEDEMQIMTFEYKEIQKKCQSFLVAVQEEDAGKTYSFSDFEILSYDTAGYVAQFRIGETICTGDQFRDALALASSSFSIKDSDGKLYITSMGKGHGLGLSQWTAQQMAEEGKNYEEILQYFFEGTSITDGGDIAEKIEAE